MFPLKMMKEAGVDLSNEVFAMKHDNVITMIYQGQVDAGATYYSAPDEEGNIRDARQRVKTQFPDVEEKVKIIAITDKIPNDPFVFRKDLPEEVTQKFIKAIKKFIKTDQGKEIFRNIYSVDGLIDATDADYVPLEKMINAINIKKEEILK
jgi:phosphonate transport system substrate-binding protein